MAEDREQIAANKTDIESTREELTATKAALATTRKDLAKAQRAIKFQAELNQGQTWDFETDTQEAYQRQVPSGAKAGAVMEYGGKTVVWNQIADDWEKAETSRILYFPKGQTITAGHKYFISYDAEGAIENVATQVIMYYKPEGEKPVQCGKVTSTGAGKKKSVVTATESGISNLTDNITGSVWMYVYQPNGGVDNIKIIDLTIMFGTGNEPTDTTDPRIAPVEAYAAARPEYNTGELLSAQVDEARVQGKNLVNVDAAEITGGSNVSISGNDIVVNKYSYVKFPLTLVVGDVVSVSFGAAADVANAEICFLLDDDKKQILWGEYSGAVEYSKKTIPITISKNVVAIYIQSWNQANNVKISDLQVERGSASAAYSPYRLETYPIPQDIRDVCLDYGIGVSADCYNYIDFAAKQYHHRVGQVDLGTLKFGKQDTISGSWRFQASFNAMVLDTTNLLTAKYPYVGDKTWSGVFGVSTKNNQLQICDMAYATADDFKAAAAGQSLYYELATPEVIDLSAVWTDDFDLTFATEPGGSITLHHPKADEGFAIDVPAKIQYITKLSEVNANG